MKPPRFFTPAEVEIIIKMTDDGVGPTEIGKVIGRSGMSVAQKRNQMLAPPKVKPAPTKSAVEAKRTAATTRLPRYVFPRRKPHASAHQQALEEQAARDAAKAVIQTRDRR
jgi:hypothetical protein